MHPRPDHPRRPVVLLCALLALLALGACSPADGGDDDDPSSGATPTEAAPDVVDDAGGSTTVDDGATATSSDDEATPLDGADVGARPERPNLLLLIADDLGVEHSVCHGANPAIAPALAARCDEALVFDNAWSSPTCSPTRAGILTGRHSFRTGVGSPVGRRAIGLDDSEITLPRALDGGGSGYAHANFGKWHLGGGPDRPNAMGWSHFSGLLSGGLGDYENWAKIENGIEEQVTTYSTTETVDDALAWIDEQSAPWLAWVAFNAPHTPFHLPPADLHRRTELSGAADDIEQNPTPYYEAAIEALDTEMDRLLASIDTDNTIVVFIGDNGSPAQVSRHQRRAAKGSLQTGGIAVPLMVWGPGVVSGRSDALVGTVDLFATLLDLAGVDPAAATDATTIDARSLEPLLSGSDGGARYLLSEQFGADNDRNQPGKTVRTATHQLIVYDDGGTEFLAYADGESTVALDPDTVAGGDADALEELTAVLADWTSATDAARPD